MPSTRHFALHRKPVGWAVLGLGMGKYHANLIRKAPDLKLVAACDSNAQLLEERTKDLPGVAKYSSMDQLLADERVEGVSVVLPHVMHAEVATRFLKAGRHVVLDKPFCLTVADGRRMIATARAERRLLSVFHNRRWDVDYVTLQGLVDGGKLGKLRYLESRISGPNHVGGGWRWRAKRATMGGLLYDWGAHLIDQAMFLFKSRPVRVYGFPQRDFPPTPECDVEDRMQALIHFEDGAVALVAWAMACPAPMPRFIAEFEHGGVRVEHLIQGYPGKKEERQGIVMWSPDPKQKGRFSKAFVPYVKADWVSYYRNIGAALRGKAELAVKPEEALKHVAVNEAAYRSAKTGQAEPLPREVF
jgi:predicted dehydrogenase